MKTYTYYMQINSILFYLNGTLRLEFSTVEEKQNQHIYIIMMICIKEGDWLFRHNY
jgi:hypothetical protein